MELEDGLIFKGSTEAHLYLQQKYKNLARVPVCAFGINSTFYEDNTYTKKVADLLYHNTNKNELKDMFGYSYKLKLI